jgi:hypothetical protein
MSQVQTGEQGIVKAVPRELREGQFFNEGLAFFVGERGKHDWG